MTKTTPRGKRRRYTAAEAIADLRERILSGDFRDPEGRPKKLPPSGKLAEEYGMSRQTMSRVLGELRTKAGLLRSRQGAGYWVREQQPLVFFPQSEFQQKPRDGIDIYTGLLMDSELQGSARIDEVTVLPAEEPVRSLLGLRKGDYVAVRRRTNFLGGLAVHTDDSYVALRNVERSDWLSKGNVDRGTNAVLAEQGHELVFAVDSLIPRMTHPDEDKRLGMEGNPLPAIELISTAYAVGRNEATALDSVPAPDNPADQQGDPDRRPVQVTIFVLPGDRNVTVYERSLENT